MVRTPLAVATELVGTSISGGGDGADQNDGDAIQAAENPHINFINRQRGYVRNILAPTEWTAEYRVVDYVTKARRLDPQSRELSHRRRRARRPTTLTTPGNPEAWGPTALLRVSGGG